MSEYVFPIKIAIVTFPFCAALFTLPFLIYQYRKHGYINYYRAFLLYSFLLYCMVAYYLVILPLPKTRDVLSLQRPGTKYLQLRPFKFVLDILRETKVQLYRPSSYIHIFKERAFLQAAFNGILLLPLGVYLSYYFNKSLKKSIAISFCASLFFELTQLSALYGIYNRPYRIFDVDDLMLNTLGGFLGYTISPAFKKLLPNIGKLDDKVNLEQVPVGIIRRSLSLGIDWSIFVFLVIVTRGLFKVYIFVFLYFIVLPYLTNGRTFGKWILRVKISGKNEKLRFSEIFLRYGLLYYVFFGGNYLVLKVNGVIRSTSNNPYYYLIVLLLLMIDFAVFVHLTIRFFSKNKILLHDKFSGTKLTVTK